MQSASAKFVDDLGLPSSQAQLMTSKLDGDANLADFLAGRDFLESRLVSLASNISQAIIGAESVDITPVDQKDVALNWYVRADSNRLVTNLSTVGLRRAGTIRQV